MTAVYAVITSFLSKNKKLIVLSIVVAYFDLFIGFRFVFVMSVIGLLVTANSRKYEPLIIRWRIWLVGIAACLAALTIKHLYVAIKMFDAKMALSNLIDIESIQLLILYSEPFVIFPQLVEVVNTNLHLGVDYFMQQFVPLIPFAPIIGFTQQPDFNYYVQEPLFGVPINIVGIAHNNFAEWYSIGGFIGVAFFSLTWIIFIFVASRSMQRAKLSYSLHVVVLTCISFYNFRNGFAQLFGLMRKSILVGLVLIFFTVLTKNILRYVKPKTEEKIGKLGMLGSHSAADK